MSNDPSDVLVTLPLLMLMFVVVEFRMLFPFSKLTLLLRLPIFEFPSSSDGDLTAVAVVDGNLRKEFLVFEL